MTTLDPFKILPKDLCILILSKLDLKDLAYCSKVSSDWKKYADDDALWKIICRQIPQNAKNNYKSALFANAIKTDQQLVTKTQGSVNALRYNLDHEKPFKWTFTCFSYDLQPMVTIEIENSPPAISKDPEILNASYLFIGKSSTHMPKTEIISQRYLKATIIGSQNALMPIKNQIGEFFKNYLDGSDCFEAD